MAPNQVLSLAELDLNYRHSRTGPAAGQWEYSTTGGAAYTVLTTSAFGTVNVSGSGAMTPLNLAAVPALQNLPGGTQVVFRLTPYGATGSTGTWYVTDAAGDDLKLIGSIAPAAVPPKVQAVAVNGGDGQRSRLTAVAVTFDSAVTLADGAVTVTRTATTAGADTTVVPAGQYTVTTTTAGGQTVATLTFTGTGTPLIEAGSLADGVYQVKIDATKVTTTAGGVALAADYATPVSGPGRIFRLFGDTDGNGTVDGTDFGAFDASFNRSSTDPLFLGGVDVDGNGTIDGTDFGAFDANFNRSI